MTHSLLPLHDCDARERGGDMVPPKERRELLRLRTTKAQASLLTPFPVSRFPPWVLSLGRRLSGVHSVHSSVICTVAPISVRFPADFSEIEILAWPCPEGAHNGPLWILRVTTPQPQHNIQPFVHTARSPAQPRPRNPQRATLAPTSSFRINFLQQSHERQSRHR